MALGDKEFEQLIRQKRKPFGAGKRFLREADDTEVETAAPSPFVQVDELVFEYVRPRNEEYLINSEAKVLSKVQNHSTISSQTVSKEEAGEANSKQEGSGLEATGKQTVSKEEAGEANSKQEGSGLEATGKQNSKREGSKTVSESVSTYTHNSKQGGSKEEAKVSSFKIGSQDGVQKNITFLIYSICKASRSNITHPLTLEYIAQAVNCTKKTAKNAIYRLVLKGVIKRESSATGIYGWTIYSLCGGVVDEIISSEIGRRYSSNNTETVSGSVSTYTHNSKQGGSKQINSDLSSSSYIYKKTTTGEEIEIYFSQLEHISFTCNHVDQILKLNVLTETQIQDSIYAFAFALNSQKFREKIKTTPLSYLMGILRSGTPFAPPSGYESPQDKANREWREHRKKLMQEEESFMAKSMEFEKACWIDSLTESQKNEIYSEDVKNSRFFKQKMDFLSECFEINIWPDLKRKYKRTEQASST